MQTFLSPVSRRFVASRLLILAPVLALSGSCLHAQDSTDSKPPAFPTIKNHPLPVVSFFSGVQTEARLLHRDPFLDPSIRGELTLRQGQKIDTSAPSSYGEIQFNEELLQSSERRLSISAIIATARPGVVDTAIINQRPFSTGDQVPVQVDTTEPAAFKKLAADRHIPCLDLGNAISASKQVKPANGAPAKVNGSVCVFLEIGRITAKGVAIRFPGGSTELALLPYNPVIRLESDRSIAR